MTAVIVQYGVFDIQVCVPADWKDQQVTKFVNVANPCGTSAGWQIRHVEGHDIRVKCAKHSDHVHIVLEA